MKTAAERYDEAMLPLLDRLFVGTEMTISVRQASIAAIETALTEAMEEGRRQERNHPTAKHPSTTVAAPGALPCPFCGSEDVHNWRSDEHHVGTWLMLCFACEAEGPETQSEEASVAAWNKRPGVAAERARCAALCRHHAHVAGSMTEARDMGNFLADAIERGDEP